MSSRNAYLERRGAGARRGSLPGAARGGARAPGRSRSRRASPRPARELDAAGIEPEYLEARDPDDLTPVAELNGSPVLLAVAARVGGARLIDNVLIDPNDRRNLIADTRGANAEADAEVEDPPRDGDRLRRRLHRQHHHRHRADGERRPDHQRAGPRLGHRQRGPLRHLRDRRRAGLGHDAGQRRRRAPDPPGHKIIVASFGAYDESDLERYSPVVVHVDDDNGSIAVDSHPEVLLTPSVASWRRSHTAPPPRPRAGDPAAARRDEGGRRTDHDGHRLRLPLGAGRRGGRRRHRPGRRLRGDGRARLPRHRAGLDGRDDRCSARPCAAA